MDESLSLGALFASSVLAATLLPGGSEAVLFGVIKMHPSQLWPALLIATVGNTLGGSAMIYVPDKTKLATLTPKLKDLIGKLEGVARIYEPGEYASLGLPTPAQNDQMADFFVVAKEGYAFTHYPTGDEAVTDVTADVYSGHHGYLASDAQLNGMFVAWGHGVKRGAQLGEIRNVDVAPTVAALLGLKLENVEAAC